MKILGAFTNLIRVFVCMGAIVWGLHSAAASDRSHIGLFEGFITFANGFTESVAIRFDIPHSVTSISTRELTTRESAALGIWENGEGRTIEFGLISYREGNSLLCTAFVPAAPPESCTLVVTGWGEISATPVSYQPAGGTTMTGEMTISVKERSSGGPGFTLPPIPFELEKRSLADLKAMQ